MIAHTSSAAIRSGPPQRGASRKRSATVPRTPAPESHRARQALTVLRQIPSLSAVPSIPRPSPKSNTMRARIASCCGVKDARIRRSSPSRSSSLNSILAALRPISSLHREIIATENQTTENKSLICESELTPTCTSVGSPLHGAASATGTPQSRPANASTRDTRLPTGQASRTSEGPRPVLRSEQVGWLNDPLPPEREEELRQTVADVDAAFREGRRPPVDDACDDGRDEHGDGFSAKFRLLIHDGIPSLVREDSRQSFTPSQPFCIIPN